MKPERFARLKKLLLQAADLPEREQDTFLNESCGDDPELMREARAILAHGANSSAVLSQAIDVPVINVAPVAEMPRDEVSENETPESGALAEPALPSEIGGYQIIRKLGEGGMGVVYEAEQQRPRRRVALKVVRGGAYLDEHRVRLFQREIQALARLRHPGIADIHESGRTEGGEHFFAMELVSGVPLDEYLTKNPITADQARTAIRARLELFRQICHCVSYAHQRGVIHRDLKPSNILVVREEERSEGRTGARGSTGTGEHGLSGSAVQVKILDFGLARITDIDVTMTTMLTEVGKIQGTLAYMSPEQARGNPDEIDVRSDVYSLGVIFYEMLTGELPYDVRRTMVHDAVRVILEEPPRKPSTLIRTLRGDVETIALKALEKDPQRRYQSAAALSEDVERFLSDQPILARPPSVGYQLRKLVVRHKTLFGAMVAVFIVLTCGLVFSTLMYLRAERERAESEAVTDFLSDTLTAVDPARSQGREVTVREKLDEASAKINQAFPEQPLVEATLRMAIGITFRELGEYAAAERHLEKALELRKRELGEGHPDTVESMTNLSRVYYWQGRFDEKETFVKQTLKISLRELGEEHPHTLRSMNSLAGLYEWQSRYDEAETLFTRTLEIRRRVLGEEHPDTVESMNNLALLYQRQHRYDEAEELYFKAFETFCHVLGKEHPWTLIAMVNLACLYQLQDRFEEAEQLFIQGIELQRRVLGEDHSLLYTSLDSLGYLKYFQGRYAEAERHYREALEGFRRVVGEEHPKTLTTLTHLVWLYIAQEWYDRAEPLCLRVLETERRLLGEDRLETLWTKQALAIIYREQGHYSKAEMLFSSAVEGARRVLPVGDWRIGSHLLEQGRCRTAMDRYVEAEAGLLEAYEILISAPAPEQNRSKGAIEALIELYEAWGKPDKAAEWRAKLPEPEGESKGQQAKSTAE